MSETETTAVTVETIDDAKVEEFFGNEGKFDDGKEPEKVELEKQTEEVKEQKEEKKVNLGALHEERQRRKEEQAARKASDERAADLERRLAQYEKQKDVIDEDDDPVESLKRKQEQIENVLLAQFESRKKQQQDSEYWKKVTDSEKAFKEDVPDFDDAISFLANTRKEELKDLGFNEQEANQTLSDEIRWIANKAYADEVNPAERFYNLAKRRGFKTETKEEVKEDNAILEKLNNIEKGIKTNKQLPPASKSVKQDLTPEALADMNIDVLGNPDFGSAWEKIMGKR